MKMFEKNPGKRTGFALVIVLMILAMTTVLAVAFAFTMRTERAVASNMVNGQRADMVAQSAVNHAISLLANNIPDPADPTVLAGAAEGRGWFSNPGRLTLVKHNSDGSVKYEPIDLFTGDGNGKTAGGTNPLKAVNLNAQSPVTLKYPITGSNDPMWVDWVNLLEDNTQAPGAKNKVIGRYAFWIDDESTKINFNTARGKTADIEDKVQLPAVWKNSVDRELYSYIAPSFTLKDSNDVETEYTLGHPASVNLDLPFFGIEVPRLQSKFAEQGRFFNNPEDIKLFYPSSDADSLYEKRKFYLTPFSRSPEFNMFGKPRIMVLNKIGDLAGSPATNTIPTPPNPWFSGVDLRA